MAVEPRLVARNATEEPARLVSRIEVAYDVVGPSSVERRPGPILRRDGGESRKAEEPGASEWLETRDTGGRGLGGRGHPIFARRKISKKALLMRMATNFGKAA